MRILNGGTEAVTRVLIESEDETGEHWTTVGVSPNIIDASFQALMDSIVYKLVKVRRAGVSHDRPHLHRGPRPLARHALLRGGAGADRLRQLDVRGSTVGFGKKYSEFWLNERPDMDAVAATTGAHVCLRATSTDVVDAFHAAALANGGASDGAPGLRPDDGAGAITRPSFAITTATGSRP